MGWSDSLSAGVLPAKGGLAVPDMNPYSSNPYGNQQDIRGFQYGRPPDQGSVDHGVTPVVQRNAQGIATCPRCASTEFTTPMSFGAALMMGWIGLSRYRAHGGRKHLTADGQRRLRPNRPVQCGQCSAEYRWDGRG